MKIGLRSGRLAFSVIDVTACLLEVEGREREREGGGRERERGREVMGGRGGGGMWWVWEGRNPYLPWEKGRGKLGRKPNTDRPRP